MKHIIALLASVLALSSCSQLDFPSPDDQMKQEYQKCRFDVKRVSNSNLTIDSCIVSTFGGDMPLLVIKSELLAFNENGRSEVFEIVNSRDSLEFNFFVNVGGNNKIITSHVPGSLNRDNLHTWLLSEDEDELSVKLSIEPWGNGGIIEVLPDSFTYSIDEVKSILPSFVRVSSSLDTIYVPSCKTDLLLVLDASIEADYMVDGSDLDISREYGDDYLGNSFRIRFNQKGLKESHSKSLVYFMERGGEEFSQKPIVIIQEASRLEMLVDYSEVGAGEIQFSDYIDGTLASVKPQFDVLSYTIDSDNKEDYQWVIMQRRSGRYNIEGGYKPNDKDANGDLQTSSITLEFSDGVQESFSFSRIRRSLPVVKFGDLYWSKYNMQGDSKSFEDQISFDQDVENLWGYLKECEGEAFVQYAGSQYCGLNTKGLELGVNSKGRLEYIGYADAFGGSTINSIETDSHCPKGYQVPTETQMISVVGSSVVSLIALKAGEESSSGYLVNKERFTVDRYRRKAISAFDKTIDNTYIIRLTNAKGESMVVNGVGYQSEPNSFNPGYWLLAAVSSAKDQAGFNNSRNNFYMQGHSAKKTVSIRCVKTPVNYVIE
ncbi:MAG: hypothetical protein ACRC6R_02460 [Bacteroidales bacterium]